MIEIRNIFGALIWINEEKIECIYRNGNGYTIDIGNISIDINCETYFRIIKIMRYHDGIEFHNLKSDNITATERIDHPAFNGISSKDR